MRKLVMILASAAGLSAIASLIGAAWSQSAPGTCSEAFTSCKSQTGLAKECEAERQWCMKTGTFANPRTKAVSLGLRKK